MAIVKVVNKTFTNDASGEITPYERLAIIGVLDGQTHTLELKLDKSQLMLAKILLASTEEIPNVETRRAKDSELDEFFNKNSGRSSGKIDITEE